MPLRSATIRRADTGPMPGTRISSSGDAVRTSIGNRSGWARAQAVLGSTASGRLPLGSKTTSLRPEAVVPQEIVGLVEPVLAQRRSGGGALQRGVLDGAEGAEVGVVNATAGVEAG